MTKMSVRKFLRASDPPPQWFSLAGRATGVGCEKADSVREKAFEGVGGGGCFVGAWCFDVCGGGI